MGSSASSSNLPTGRDAGWDAAFETCVSQPSARWQTCPVIVAKDVEPSNRKATMKKLRKHPNEVINKEPLKAQEQMLHNLSPAHHKRILKYINDAGSPFDLM